MVEVCTEGKGFGPVVEEQEGQQVPDGIDGPSKNTDLAVPPAIFIGFG